MEKPSLEEVIAKRHANANIALTDFRTRLTALRENGPAFLKDYAEESWSVVKDHDEVTKSNATGIRDAIMEINNTYRGAIYHGLVERGELDEGFGILHDTIHDAAMLTNGIYFLSRKW